MDRDYKFVIWKLGRCRHPFSKVTAMSKGIAEASRRRLNLNKKDIIMRSRKLFLLSLAAVAIAAPGLASASSLYHTTGGEIGYVTHPEHQQSTKSRSEVLQAVEVARKDGTLAIMSRGASLPMKMTGPGKTREQVQQHNLTMTEDERKYRQELYGAGG